MTQVICTKEQQEKQLEWWRRELMRVEYRHRVLKVDISELKRQIERCEEAIERWENAEIEEAE